MEVWKKIDGFDKYEVSNIGNIRSPRKLMKKSISHKGYFIIFLGSKKNKKTLQVHRLVAFAFLENTFNKPFINHKDGNKQNNHVDNLEWCTAKENTRHALNNGLIKTKTPKKESARILNNKKIWISVIDLSTGKIYESIKLASDDLNISQSLLSDYLSGRRTNKTTLRYYKKNNDI